MRGIACLLLVATSAPADEADDFFEVGLAYLRTAFYRDARAAFAECLVRAPGEPVPTAFAAVACAGEGRDSRSCAQLFRLAYRRLPARTALTMDLGARLRSAEDRERIERRFRQRLASARGQSRLDQLTVLAFFEMHDGSPETSPALDALLEARPDDPYARALAKLRPPKKKEEPKSES
jgi:hypothetical protein